MFKKARSLVIPIILIILVQEITFLSAKEINVQWEYTMRTTFTRNFDMFDYFNATVGYRTRQDIYLDDSECNDGFYAQSSRIYLNMSVNDDSIVNSLEKIYKYEDCMDFRMNSLIRMLYLDINKSILSTATRDKICDALGEAKYWHIAMGFNAIVITVHNTLDNKDEIKELKKEYKKDDIIIIQGMEWTTDKVHMNFIGIDEWDLEIPRDPSDSEIKKAIKEVHDQKGVVTCNHIPWSINEAKMEGHPSRRELLKWGVDYIELVNEDTYDKSSLDWWEDLDSADQDRIGFITGTDMHEPGSVYGWTFIKASEISEDAIMDKLRAINETVISYSSIGYEDEGVHQLNPGYVILSPIMHFGGMFYSLYTAEGLDWIGILVYFGYIFAIFGIIEANRILKPKLKKKLNERKNQKKDISK